MRVAWVPSLKGGEELVRVGRRPVWFLAPSDSSRRGWGSAPSSKNHPPPSILQRVGSFFTPKSEAHLKVIGRKDSWENSS